MNQPKREHSGHELVHVFWLVLILATFACLTGWFNLGIDKILTTLAVIVGWFYVIEDSWIIRRRNKQRREEYPNNKEESKN